MSAYSKKRKKCSGTYPSSCEWIAKGEDVLLVKRVEARGCDGVGEPIGPFVFLRRYRPPQQKTIVFGNVLSLALFALFAYAFAYSVSLVTTMDLNTAFFSYAGTTITLAALQAVTAYVLARALGASLQTVLLPVPSPLPSFMPMFFVEKPFASRKGYARATLFSMLITLTVAIALAYTFVGPVAYPKAKVEVINTVPFAFINASGNSPVVAACVAYALSLLFQLTGYPYSPSWALLGNSLGLMPLLVGLAMAASSPPLGEIVAGYVLVSALLSIFVKEKPQWKDPFERPSALEAATALIVLALCIPVVV